MDKTWFYLTPTCLQWPEKAWNDLLEQSRCEYGQFFIWAMRFLLFVEHSFHSSRKPCLPGVAPRVIIADIRQMRCNWESIVRRFSHTIQVNSRHKSTEALNIRQVVCHVKKIANVKMFVGFLLVRSPGHWLRNIVGGEMEQHFFGFECASHHVTTTISKSTLQASVYWQASDTSIGGHPIPRMPAKADTASVHGITPYAPS